MLNEAAADRPRLRQHLNQCRVCSDEYGLPRDLARQEADGRLPPDAALRQDLTGG